jgi:type I restriction enzyme S subunit
VSDGLTTSNLDSGRGSTLPFKSKTLPRWAIRKIGDFALKVGSGATPRGGNAVYKTEGVPLIRSMNVHFAGFRSNGLVYLDPHEARFLEHVTVRRGDVLLNITGASIGRVTFAPDFMDGARVNQHVCIIRPSDELLPAFLAYFLASPNEQARIMNVQVGVTRQALTKAMVLSWQVPIPVLDEQYRIVSEIEKQFTRLDAGVASLKQVQIALKRYRASVLKTACEGRLVPTEAELARREGRSFEAGSALLDRILKERQTLWETVELAKFKATVKISIGDKWKARYKEPIQPNIECAGRLPEGWTWASADQCTTIITDGEHITPQRSTSGVLLLSARNILNGKVSLEDVDYVPDSEYHRIAKRLVINPGDVLLSCSGSVGRSCVAPAELRFTLVRSVAVLKPLMQMGKFLSIALRGPQLQEQINAKKTQTAQANIFQGKIKVLVFPMPPIAEQQRIVAEAERQLSFIEELDGVVAANLKRAERLRQSILHSAFTGKL